jgi:hypothetical protein
VVLILGSKRNLMSQSGDFPRKGNARGMAKPIKIFWFFFAKKNDLSFTSSLTPEGPT